ncbi:uncharacterized protein LOC133716166 [Rosa rugosa]|uniref:uncharacterized protein LOC133716166 n=1 Tax=Rosa rugosa TaxID=74645 RepID=UPI002B4164DD|nr:uncharacterized protein LOC133716166 [Rosa rugosa]
MFAFYKIYAKESTYLWLPLFLGLLFNVVCNFHSYSELWDSVHSVMASDIRHRRGKRLLEQNDSEGLNRDAEIETRNNSENFYTMRAQIDTGGFNTEGMHQRRSRRPRRVPEPAITEKNYTSEHLNRGSRRRRRVAEPAITEINDTSEHLNLRVEPTEQNNSLLLNQTSVNSEDSHVSHTVKDGMLQNLIQHYLLFHCVKYFKCSYGFEDQGDEEKKVLRK